MDNNKFSKFFGKNNLPGKKQTQKLNTDNTILSGNIIKSMKDIFGDLMGAKDIILIQKIGEDVLYRVIYFSNHADLFYKFTEMSEEEFKIRIADIKREIEEFVKCGSLKDISKIQILNDWLVELEKLLDQRLLSMLDQQCQEIYSLLLLHADKSQSFDARSPEDFRVFLQEIGESHHVAKSQLAAYSSGKADIRVKDSGLTTLREVNHLLRSLKGTLSKQLSKVRESADELQKEFDQSYHNLLLHVEQAHIFVGEEPEEFRKKLGKMKEGCLAASSQIERYLSGTESSEEKKCQAFDMLEKSLADIKEIEKNLVLVFDIRSHVDKTSIELQRIYKWLFEYAEQSQYFANQKPQEFKESLKRIRTDHKYVSSYLEKCLSGEDRSEENYLHALQKLKKYFGEIKKIEANLDSFLLKKFNGTISQTYHKLLKHGEQSPHFTSQQRQNFINDLKDINRRREQAKNAIEMYIAGNEGSQSSEKKSKAFRVLEEIEQDLNLSLANEINAEIMHRRNRLDKYQAAEEEEQSSLKERLKSIETQRKHANAKLEPYFSGNGISEEDKHIAFEILEECLEETNVVEIEMTPFFRIPLIEKIDQSYGKLVQGEERSPIFTKQELQEFNKEIYNVRNAKLINKTDNNENKLFVENFNELSKLERRISLYLRLQMLHNHHVKVCSRIEKHLNTPAKFDSEEKKKIRRSIEQNVVDTNSKFNKVKKVLQEDDSPMRIEYFGELALNEYDRSIESLTKQASRSLGFDIRLHSPKAE